MKSKAFILFILFSMVQVGPAIKSFISDNQNIIFVVDEEKQTGGSEKAADDNKNMKEFSKQAYALKFFDNSSRSIFHDNESLNLSPVFDILTPPPDRA